MKILPTLTLFVLIIIMAQVIIVIDRLDDANHMIWEIDYMMAEEAGYANSWPTTENCLFEDGSYGHCYPDSIIQKLR